MAQWTGGYVADVSYTAGFYREITPSWMAFVALVLGHRPPDLSRPFRWAELGCGQGFTATVAAASHPQAEFWGFDFNPSHIDNATHLAAAAGLDNLHFREAAFADLAAAPDGAYPQFDFIVMHGIWSWVSAEQRAHLQTFIRRHLAPGGLVYNSYNTLAGWAAMLPIQRLMRAWAERNPGPSHEMAAGVIKYLQELARTDAVFFQQNGAVVARLEQAGTLDPRYFAHEYLNTTWEPTTFDQVAAEMQNARCGYIGSTTLTDNMDVVAAPAGIGKVIGQTGDPVMRELLRDLAAARPFRRDLYRRGTDQPATGEHTALLNAITITGLGRESETEFQIATGIGHVTPRPEIYTPVLQRLAKGPLGMAELRQMPALAGQALAEALQVVAFLAAGGLAHPTPNEHLDAAALAPARRLNLEVARLNEYGGNSRFLAAPRVGSALGVDPVEAILVPDLDAGRGGDIAGMVDKVLAILAQTGRAVMKDGLVVPDPKAARAAMTETVTHLVQNRLPVLRRLGIVGEAG